LSERTWATNASTRRQKISRVPAKLCMCAIRGVTKTAAFRAAENAASSSSGVRHTSRSPIATNTGTSIAAASAATAPG
jgi:hypothetical protein